MSRAIARVLVFVVLSALGWAWVRAILSVSDRVLLGTGSPLAATFAGLGVTIAPALLLALATLFLPSTRGE